MPSLEDADDRSYAALRTPGRFQVSKRFKKTDPAEPSKRYAYEVYDTRGDVSFDSEDGWEVALRTTTSRQQLKAVFFEVGRGVPYLAFQRFTPTGKPINDKKTLVLNHEEIAILRDFLARIELVDLVGTDGVRISAEAGRQLLEGRRLPADLLRERATEVAEFLRSDLSAPDVTALARRREALRKFEQMLAEVHPEQAWQAFLEAHPWILGAAGAPQFLHRVGDTLEQVVRGWDDLGDSGKRVDSLMRTAGALSALTFVEIKRPDTSLLRYTPYRSGTRRLLRRESRRQANGTTGLVVGDLDTLTSIVSEARYRRLRSSVAIVQPGMSKTKASDDMRALLGGTQRFLEDTFGMKLRVIASA